MYLDVVSEAVLSNVDLELGSDLNFRDDGGLDDV